MRLLLSWQAMRRLALMAVAVGMVWLSGVTGMADSARHMVSVPAIAVSVIAGKETGRIHYIVVQVDQDPKGAGPVILFNEIQLGGGSSVGAEWKDGVRRAVQAAAQALSEDSRSWLVTIKNRSYNSLTEGSSASAAVAVAVMAARRGDAVRSGILLTGSITAEGQIEPVGQLSAKLDGAAQERMHTFLVPQGQAQTADWDLYQQARLRNIKVLEVATLREAYEVMTGRRS